MGAKSKLAVALLMSMVLILLSLPAHAQEDIVIPEGTPINIGDTVEGQLTAEAPIVAYTFAGQEGDALSFALEDEEYRATYILIADAEGEILFWADTDNTGTYTSFIPLYILPEDGTYSVAVTSSSYFYLQEPDDEDAPYTLTVFPAAYDTIAYGDVVEGTLSPEQTYHVYAFEGAITDVLYVMLETEDGDLLLTSITDPDFSDVSGNTPPGTEDVYISPFYLMDDDMFSIIVYNTYIYEGEAPYSLSLNEYEPTPIASGETVEVQLAVETLSNFLVFDGAKGQDASVTVEAPVADMTFTQVIFDPDGQVIAVADYGDNIEEVRLPEDGAYILALFPDDYLIDSSMLGAIKVSLEIE